MVIGVAIIMLIHLTIMWLLTISVVADAAPIQVHTVRADVVPSLRLIVRDATTIQALQTR